MFIKKQTQKNPQHFIQKTLDWDKWDQNDQLSGQPPDTNW